MRSDIAKLRGKELSNAMRRIVQARYAKPNPIFTSRVSGMTPEERSAEMRRIVNVRWAKRRAEKKAAA